MGDFIMSPKVMKELLKLWFNADCKSDPNQKCDSKCPLFYQCERLADVCEELGLSEER